jgi:PKD repeat protein
MSFLLPACRKQELLPETEPVTPAPSFQLTMTASSLPVHITAGLNDYYMYSSYSQDSGVYTFKGELKQIHCSNCPNSLTVSIRDVQTLATNQNTTIGNALYPGYFPYHKGTAAGPVAYDVQFYSQTTAQSYNWNFGDGSQAPQANPQHTYAHPGTYTVSLASTSTVGCSSSMSNVYKVGVPGSDCQIYGISADTTGGTITFLHNITGTAPFTYAWDFGDGTTSALASPSHNFTPGSYNVTLQITDANNQVATSTYNHVQGAGCSSNFSLNPVITPLSNPSAFSNIVITWSDALGNVYTSDNAAQPASSYFQIVSVEDFDKNENGQTTKKLRVKFSCTVYNGINSIVLNNAEATIAMAYK